MDEQKELNNKTVNSTEENTNNSVEKPTEITNVTEQTESTNEAEKNKEPKNNKKKIYIIIIIAAVLLIGVTVFVLVNKNKDDNKPKTKEELKENKKEENKEEKTNGFELKIYGTKESLCQTSSKVCNKLYYTIPVDSKNAYVMKTHELDYVLIKDGDQIKYYDNNDKKTHKLNLPVRDDYQLGISDGKLYSIIYYNNVEGVGSQNTGMYIISEDKIMLDNVYDNLSQEDYGLVAAYNNGKNEDELPTVDMYLISQKDWKIVHERKEIECGNYSMSKTKNSYFIYVEKGCGFSYTREVYTKDLKSLTPTPDSKILSTGEDYIEIISNKNVIKYDEYGNVINKSKDYEKLLGKTGDYLIFVENNKIKITDEKDLTMELTEWNDKYQYNNVISNYYTKEMLDGEIAKEEGWYFLFELKDNLTKGFEIYFNPTTKEVKRFELENIEHGYAKPVLYLYPEKETNIKVNFENEDSLTTTYPKFKNEWEVLAKPNGDLYDKNGKYYYGLYWEEKGNHKVDFNEGFYVTKDNAIEFLEEKLSYIGLNDRERNEFIMYWLPILEKNEKNLIYFELTNEREEYNKINISPSPDSLLRIAMHVKKVDKKVNIKEQKLSKFERKGFSAIEWGGVLYN